MRVTYCPTEEMIADFFTKPLQGGAFIRFWDFILNVDSMTHAATNHRSVLDNDQSHKSDVTNLACGEEQVHVILQLHAADLTNYTYKLISSPRKG